MAEKLPYSCLLLSFMKKSKSILVLSPDNSLVSLLRSTLLPRYSVQSAHTKETLLEELKNRFPDLLMLRADASLKETGHLVTMVRKLDCSIPIIGIVRCMEEQIADRPCTGIFDVLMQPFSPEELLSRIRRTLAAVPAETRRGSKPLPPAMESFIASVAAEIAAEDPGLRRALDAFRERYIDHIAAARDGQLA